MKPGKQICETLKGIRADIAQANGIEYTPAECTHEGDCAGTCPACDSETRWLERQLRLRRQLGKAVAIAGIGLGAGVFAAQGTGMPANRPANVQQSPCDSTGYQVYGYVSDCIPPTFRGGERALMAYLAEHIVLPDSLQHITGRIVTQFTIERDGTVTDVNIVRDPIHNPTVNAIIIDALQHLPRFVPSREKGRSVTFTYTLPINFPVSTQDNDKDN